MTDESNDEMQDDIRKALQLSVCKIVFDEDHKQGTRTSQSAIAALTELTYQYATKSLVPDLYSYSTHANRKSTISPDDVALVLRKIQPDQLENFKSNFCRGGSNRGSKTNAGYSENNGRRGTTTAGRRRKRGETDVLSLSSSSSSSSDDDDDNNMVGGKQKRKPNRSIASSHETSTTISERKSTERESLLSKFRLRPSASIGTKKKRDYDFSLSSDDGDILVKSPPKGLAKAKTATVEGTKAGLNIRRSPNKLSLKTVPFRQKQQSLSKSSRGKNNRLLDSDSDSSDDEDGSFLGANTTKKTMQKSNKNAYASSDQENEYDFENVDDDDDDDEEDDEFVTGNNRLTSKGNSAIGRGTPKQSQVAEALANLSSDSGMDEDSEDEIAMNTGKAAFKRRHRPRIDSDDGD